MRRHVPLIVALCAGLIVGAVVTVALCNAGLCGNRESTTGQAVTTPTGVVAIAAAETKATEAPVVQDQNAETLTAILEAAATVGPESTASPEETVTTFTAEGPVCPVPSHERGVQQIKGLAILGASTADEYHGNDQRGGLYAASTFNWVELLVRERGINVGDWGHRPEPRRAGYEFNWARSGATTMGLIWNGQHTGVAAQIIEGKVSHVIIQIGLNDFYHDDVAYQIYRGELDGEALDVFLNSIISNVQQAVQAVKIAGENRVILAATPDYVTPALLPEITTELVEPEGRQRLIDAFTYFNEGLRDVAAAENVTFFDFNSTFHAEIESRRDPQESGLLVVGDQRIDVRTRGDQPRFGFLDDDVAHPGTVLSGLMAKLFIEQMNSVFDEDVEPLGDDEILCIAGLR